ncbi:LysR family substrate-binding domain-containing protein [Streptomyces sp. NPDC059832]|uniref:LysR family substrate-binding domain-containing protein n=1 Tax=unclassified Streptomyces TaxID=2593676 RepID=UPI00364C7913
MSRFAAGAEGVPRIGLTGSAAYRQLPALARLMKREMPNVMLEVHTEMLTPAQEEALTERRLDVGILRPPVRQDGIAHRTVAVERLVVAMPEQHPLTQAESASAEELRDEEFILHSAGLGSVLNDAVVRTCLGAGYYPKRAYEVGETSGALALVAAGLGIAVLPESVRAAPREGVECRDLTDGQSVRLDLAWREDDTSPLLRSLVSTLERNDVFLDRTEGAS